MRAVAAVCAAILLVACGGSGHAPPRAAARRPAHSSAPARGTFSPLARWRIVARPAEPVDLSAPRSDGRLVLAANGRLFLFAPPHGLVPFARGSGGYSTRKGLEPYIALTSHLRVPGAGCSFGADELYALAPYGHPGVIRVDPGGHAARFATLPAGWTPDGIAFDRVGRFGHRLLISRAYALDCRGRLRTLAHTAPRVEGGIAVAPASFGAFGGWLIAPNEDTGQIFAIAPSGRARLLANSGLPAGGDLGVESIGFVPSHAADAYVSDRFTPAHHYHGDNAIDELSAAELRAAGVRAGDMLVATEGRGLTDDIRCAQTCTVRKVAIGPPEAYFEGHIEFAP
jgi:hypothetical protein